MKTAILIINEYGEKIAEKLKRSFEDAVVFKVKRGKKELTGLVGEVFDKYDGIIFISALGIVVRAIAPFIKNKFTDPAVVCIDTAGRFSISVLSSHEGGANGLSFSAASALGALPVITTGTETRKRIIIGIGCRKDTTSDEVKKAVLAALKEKNITLEKVRLAATVDLKKGEKGLIKACAELGLPLVFIQRESIESFHGIISSSEIVKRRIGLKGVCEPCALLAGRKTKLILKKRISGRVTIAIAGEN